MSKEIQFATALQPAEITADFDAMAKRLDELLEPYEDMDGKALAKMELKDIEACHKDVNAIINSVEDGRKAVKKIYNQPLDEFERRCKELLEPARIALGQIKEARDARKEAERENLLDGLRNTYLDAAPLLADVVPFERILEINPKWANKSYGAAKAANELVEATAKIAKDWRSLQSQKSSMGHYQEAEREFFRTLDLGAAIEFNRVAEEEQMRIDNMKAEVDANRAAQGEPEVIVVEAPETAPETRRYVVRVECTESQIRSLVAWLKAQNIHGSFGEVA